MKRALAAIACAAGRDCSPVQRIGRTGTSTSSSPMSRPQAGIHFTHNAGRRARNICPRRWAPACAFFDSDGDGWPDILLVNGKDFDAARPAHRCRALP